MIREIMHVAFLISSLSSEKVTLSADSLQQLLLQQQVRNIEVSTCRFIPNDIYQLVCS